MKWNVKIKLNNSLLLRTAQLINERMIEF